VDKNFKERRIKVRHKLITLVLAVAVIVSLVVVGCAKPTPAQAPEKTWELKFAGFIPAVARTESTVYEPYVKQIEDATNGKVKVTIYAGGVLANETEVWEAVETGLADIVYVAVPELYPGRTPLSNLSTLPMAGAPSCEIFAKALLDIYHKFPEVQEEYAGVKLLTFFGIPPVEFHTT